MFHCYKQPLNSASLSTSLPLQCSTTSLISLIKTRSNYSAVLAMDLSLPHMPSFKRGDNNNWRPIQQDRRHLFNYQSMDAPVDARYYEEKRKRNGRRKSLLLVKSISIDVPLMPLEKMESDNKMLVTYKWRKGLKNIKLQFVRSGNTETDALTSQKELSDTSTGRRITPECSANIELSQFGNGIRMGKKSCWKNDGEMGTTAGAAKSLATPPCAGGGVNRLRGLCDVDTANGKEDIEDSDKPNCGFQFKKLLCCS